MKFLVLPLAALVAGLVAVASLATPPKEPPRGPYNAPLLPRLEVLKVLGAGQRPMVTDYFWLQAIQAAGRAGTSLAKERWLDLYYYADLVTDLDPKFYKVYGYAGTAVPTNLGRETYVNVDEGIKLLEKGTKHFPNDWLLHYYLGSSISYLKKDHKRAAEILQRAAKMEGAPQNVNELATRLLAVQGDFDAAFDIVETAIANEDDPRVREALEKRRLELVQERVLQIVDDAIREHQTREGTLPDNVGVLVQKGYLSKVPRDPMGGEIFIGKDGRAYSSAAEERFAAIDYEYRRKQKYGDEGKQ